MKVLRRRLHPIWLVLLFTLGCLASGSASFLPPVRHAWQTFTTDHYQFYFYRETEPLARHLAPLAEQIHNRLVQDLSMAPTERTHVVIYDDTDEFNGAAMVFPRNTIFLFATADYAGGYGRVGDSMLETFAHEYTHILQMGYVTDLPEAVSNTVGRVLLPNMYLPPWCTEGLAVAMESELFPSGRLHSSTWRMYLRADFLAGRILTWPQVSNGIYRWPYENAWYLYGSYFTQYLIDKYGRDKVAEFYRATGGDLPFLTLAGCFRSVFGLGLNMAVADWRGVMAAEFQAEAECVKAAGLLEGTPVASFGGRSGQGTFAPGGELYFLRRTYDSPTRLIRAEPPYRRAGAVTTLEAGRPAVSPDGKRMAYGLATVSGENLFNDLFLLDLRRGRSSRLTRGLRANDPSWSPDGREIAFVKNIPPNFSLYRIRADGNGVAPIWQASGREQAFCPAWSPQGDRIAFVRYRPEDGLRLWLIRPDGSGLTVLRAGPALGEELDPAWSPDGRYLYFAADPTGIFNIYAYDTEANALYQVTNVLTGAYDPSISPDGKTLAYTGYTAAGYDQYVAPVDRAAWRPCTSMGPPRTTPGTAGQAEHPAPPAYFQDREIPPVAAPAGKYSPWPTLRPAFGYTMISGSTTGEYDIQLVVAGMDVLETMSYVCSVESSGFGPGYQVQLDFRLRPFTLSLYSDLTYEEDYLTGYDWRSQSAQVLLGGGTGGLLAPNDSLDWALLAYQLNYVQLNGTCPPETYWGGELSLAYSRISSCRGPVDTARGFRLGLDLGVERLLQTGESMIWRDVWGRLYVPLGASRLEIGAGLDRNTAGEAEVNLGRGFVPGPEGYLLWEAEASLEFPFLQPESGGSTSPSYIHAMNGLLSVYGGQTLDPVGSMAYSYGLGMDFRLQMGFSIPFDLSMMWVRSLEDDDWYWLLWYKIYY